MNEAKNGDGPAMAESDDKPTFQTPQNKVSDLPITEIEMGALEQLFNAYPSLRESFQEQLTQLFIDSRLILTRGVSEKDGTGLATTQFAFLGLTHRTHELLLGCINGVASGNRSAFVACFRGLLETLAASIWVTEKSGRLISLLDDPGPGVGQMMNAAYNKIPDLRNDYDRASCLAHPYMRSLLACVHVQDHSAHTVLVVLPSPSPSIDEAGSNLRGAVTAVKLIFQTLKEMLDATPSEVGFGRPVAQRLSNES